MRLPALATSCHAWHDGDYGWPPHLVNCLTRLSGLVPSGTREATVGNCVLLLATIPLIRAARVVTCLARFPVGSLGYH
jgi:hypothetical protein